jgi:hypothetical protein
LAVDTSSRARSNVTTPARSARATVALMLTIASEVARNPASAAWCRTATSSSSVSVPSQKASKMRPTPTMPKAVSSDARSAPMLAAPHTWMPCDSAHKISLCHTAGTRSK